MSENKRTPAIRFRGFSGDWEKRKIGDILSIADQPIVMLDDKIYQLVTIKRRNDGIISRGFVKGKNILEKNYFEIKEGDFLISKRQVIHGANGYVPKNLNNAVVSNEYMAAVSNENISSKFLALISRRKEMYKLYLLSSYGVDIEKIVFNVDDWRKRSIIIPNLEEQEKIIEFFDYLDKLISLHQKKHTQLIALKKAMLEKMFPKEGETIPGIRFAGFTESWIRKSFSEITFPSGIKNHDNLPLESYSITNEHGFIPQNEKFENGGTMRETDKRMYYIVTPNSFAYNPARINVGSIGYQNIGKDVIVSSLYEIFKTTSDVDDRFLWHWFKSNDFQKLILQLQEGGVRLYFYYDKLCMGSLALLELKEQYLIGKFLDNLDALITLHQNKIDQLQHLKKAFLDKMFV